MQRALQRHFYEQPTITVAKELLGKFLVVRCGGEMQERMITEVEAYIGPFDKACHARHGQTARNFPMFGPAGIWYLYLCMGIHWMLNIVTREPGCAEAILIRGVEGCSGPGRVTKCMGIDKRFQARPATEESGLWVEDRGVAVPASLIRKGPRVGIDYAGPYWTRRHLRFWIEHQKLKEMKRNADSERQSHQRRTAQTV